MVYAIIKTLIFLATAVKALDLNYTDPEVLGIVNNLTELDPQFHTQHACANAILTAFYVAIGELDDSAEERIVAGNLITAYGMLFKDDHFRMINDIYRDRPNDEEFAPYFERFNVTEAECYQETDYDGVLKEGFIKSGLDYYMRKAYAQLGNYLMGGESPKEDVWSRVDDDPNDGADGNNGTSVTLTKRTWFGVNWRMKWADGSSSWRERWASVPYVGPVLTGCNLHPKVFGAQLGWSVGCTVGYFRTAAGCYKDGSNPWQPDTIIFFFFILMFVLLGSIQFFY